MPEFANRLAGEKSPYLLQHAHNPVDWYPWGDEAFSTARTLDRPVFLSIGYSTCHWCHVMERESFEDGDVASLLNEHFVCVKVDREERPDIDGVYMDAAVLMTGRGGWPLTILMTPEGTPFYAATYLPKEGRLGMPGLIELLPRVAELWRERRRELLATADRVKEALETAAGETSSETDAETLRLRTIESAERELAARFDGRHAGFGRAPKFPSPHNLIFLLRRWRRTGDEALLRMVEATLDAMRNGGIYDQIGFGFHRYSTDESWLVPHFEKMLYDQALLALAYTEAAAATRTPRYEETAREVIEYVLRDMTSPSGAFYSAEDADSEGAEGRFYVWSTEELRAALDPEDAELATALFGATEEGNARRELADAADGTGPNAPGPNVLHMPEPLNETAEKLGLAERELRHRLASIKEKLRKVRERRVRPGRDEKILTDWNSLMISALSSAAWSFDERRYAHAAERAADFILGTMRDDEGRLLHSHCGGESAVRANADDYAFLVAALLDLYQATFEAGRLSQAVRLNDEFIEGFQDNRHGAFFFTARYAEPLLIRKKNVHDGAIPSANSIALQNLRRLHAITGDPRLEDMAWRLASALLPEASPAPSAYTMLLSSVDALASPSQEVVVVSGSDEDGSLAMLRFLRKSYAPGRTVLLLSGDEGGALASVAPWTSEMTAIDGRATAYICSGRTCDLPVTSVEGLLERV